ncbi:MAG: hypothetical protein WC352_05025 [Candidatus Omnitrophota bacterium]|jgi:hypothetical protein
MKKVSLLVLAVLFLSTQLLGFLPVACAQSEGGKPSPVAPKISKQDEEARAALRKKILEKKDELNGSEWAVEIKSRSAKGDFAGEDTLTFQNDKFRSGKTEKSGYTATNYTLTVSEEENGPTVWETMQTSANGEITFWRGEWKDDVMTGVISRQLKEEKGVEEYYFSSSLKKEIPKTTEETEEPAAPVASEAKSAASPILSSTAATADLGSAAIEKTGEKIEEKKTVAVSAEEKKLEEKKAAEKKKSAWLF